MVISAAVAARSATRVRPLWASCAASQQGQTQCQCHVPAPVDAGPQVGLTCATDADCAAIPGARCATGATGGEFDYPVGFCTINCTAANTCPTGAECVIPPFTTADGGVIDVIGQDTGVCAPICDPEATEAPCADNFTCAGVSMDQTEGFVCVPVTPMPAGLIGKACTSAFECAFPPTNGACITAANGFPNGQCSAFCNFGESCGPEGVCVGLFSDTATCHPTCAEPGQRSTCAAGYSCYGLQSGGGTCLPDCTSELWVACADRMPAQTCNMTTGQCE